MLITYLIIGLVIAAALSVVTVHAMSTAPEGYEDEQGFHPLSSSGTSDLNRPAENADHPSSADDLPPFAATR